MDDVAKILAEGNALTEALTVVEEGCGMERALELCLAYLNVHEVVDHESKLVDCALRKICGLPLETYTSTPKGTSEDTSTAFEVTSTAWMTWAREGFIEVPLDVAGMGGMEDPRRGGGFDVLAISQWAEAIQALSTGSLLEARRLFRRATHLGSEYATPSNPAIQWSYAATFMGVSA